VSARLRVWLVVGAAALVAAGATVAATVLSRDEPEREAAARPAGAPVLLLDLGVRVDPEARALRRASSLYSRGRRSAAGRIFDRYDSLDARVGAAMSAWPRGTVTRLTRLEKARPESGLVRLHLGIAYAWSGKPQAAVAEFRAAGRVEPNSLSAIRANDFLYPRSPRGVPVFVPSVESRAELAGLSPGRQLAVLRLRARSGGLQDKLAYGSALQRLGRPVSAEREFAAAARLAPRDPEPRVAVAVARFRKDEPARAFSRLGPLAGRYPSSQSVRFHLGLLLLWLGEVEDARRQMERARTLDPVSRLGTEASRYLDRLEGVGTD